jgi:hypothetical protein
VAAAVSAAAAGGAPGRLQARLVAVLASMHQHNAAWGPLKVAHPGDLARHRFTTLLG